LFSLPGFQHKVKSTRRRQRGGKSSSGQLHWSFGVLQLPEACITFQPPPESPQFSLSLEATSSEDLSYKDCHWHEQCFKCAKCSRPLVEKPFAAKDEQLLCTECYSHEYSSKCSTCKKTIMPGSRKMEYKGNSWHETCFLCHRCQQPIGTKSFIPKDNGYFCVPCFEKQFAYQCCACKKVRILQSHGLDCMLNSDCSFTGLYLHRGRI
uniref:Four and a half LIM domains 5 n=1 Tax=Hucho hucho TaxID=62062 RepID=A0A4W5QNT3_9TELE